MGNDDKVITSSVAGNQEDDYSLEWDGFVLAENLINLDDLDIFWSCPKKKTKRRNYMSFSMFYNPLLATINFANV